MARVSGPSMTPTLVDGDRVLVRYGVAIRPGSVVVLVHPTRADLLLIKRAVRQQSDGRWWVLGDNPYTGGDSTDFGAVPAELIVARALLRVAAPPAPGRRARLRWARTAVRRLRPAPAAGPGERA
jgi:nickel-type superoxide dismutase maturation protease